MTQQYDPESAQLRRDAAPAKAGSVRQLKERVDDLERRLVKLEGPQCRCTFGLTDPFCAVHGDGME